MIRPATLTDIPALVVLGRLMHDESPRFCVLPYSPDKVRDMLRVLINEPFGFAWVAEDADGGIVGGMIAALMPHWCSEAVVASDLALFVAPSARGTLAPVRLLNTYRSWAKAQGAVMCQFGVTTGVQTEATAALVERIGFKRCGVVLEA